MQAVTFMNMGLVAECFRQMMGGDLFYFYSLAHFAHLVEPIYLLICPGN